MQICRVAKEIGLTPDAIRFYERNALLPRPPRTPGGFRQYGENDVETLAFIRRVQGLGFTLREIRGLLKLRGNRLQPCAPVQRQLQNKLGFRSGRSPTSFRGTSTSCGWPCGVATRNYAGDLLDAQF